MNKVVLVSDLHFGTHRSEEYFLENQLNYFDKELIPYLTSNKITTVFMLGDLFEARNLISVKIKDAVYHLFERLEQFKIYILLGNHDIYYNTHTEVHSLNFLRKFSNVTLIEKMTKINIFGKDCLFVPWITDEVKFIEDIKNVSADYCMGHFDIIGYSFNKSKLSEEGLVASIFNQFKLVFSGHYHIRSSQKNIVYVGSPYSLTRADVGVEKGICVLDMEDGTYENVNSKTTIRYINLVYPEQINKDLIKGNIVDVEVKYDKEYAEERVHKYLKEIEACEPLGNVTVKLINEFLTAEEVEKLNNIKFTSNQQLMDDYITEIDIPNKSKVHKIITDLYKKVS